MPIRRFLWCVAIAAGAAGCAGGPSSSTNPQNPPRELPTLSSTATDKTIETLAPARVAAASDLDRSIDAYLEHAATRRTYIMTDKPLYQPGETIWLRADIRATKTLLGGPPVGIALQLTSPRGSIVVAKRVLAQGGVARNDFQLPDDLEGGEYTINLVADDGTTDFKKIVVNTYEAPRLMKTLELLRKAYGEGDTVTAAVEVKQTTGEPFAKKKLTAVVTLDDSELARDRLETDKEGKAVARFQLPAKIARGDGLLTILVEDGGVTESIQKRIPIVMKTLQLGLFPEGGDLVDNVPGRVYFMAKTTLGKPADIEGRVVDDRGTAVAEFASIHDGMGRFELTPAPDRRYRVEIVKPAGITAKFEVPATKPGGCVIRSVDQHGASALRIAAICNTARTLHVAATLREKRIASGAFDVPANQATVVELPVPATAQGVARVTLFSTREEPLAERLVYHAMGGGLRVALAADRTTYAPRDPVKLRVHTTDANGAPVKANVAVAVTDETVLSFADDKSARLLAHIFLEPELGATAADPIEEPNFYFGDKPEAAAAMDALLATRGYRRFEWRQVLPQGGQP